MLTKTQQQRRNKPKVYARKDARNECLRIAYGRFNRYDGTRKHATAFQFTMSDATCFKIALGRTGWNDARAGGVTAAFLAAILGGNAAGDVREWAKEIVRASEKARQLARAA